MEAATKKYVDDAVSAGGGSGGGGDVSKDYVDQQITTLQNQLDDKVNKSGDTMTGDLNMDGQQIQNAVLSSNTGTVLDNGAGGPGILTNLATPSGDTDAAPKKYVDDTIKQQIDIAVGDLGDDYLPTAGGQMSGDIDMSGNSVVKFSDPPPTSRYRSVRAAAPSVVKGSVYNDNEDMCVKSENGQVRLMGSEVALSDGAGEKVKITGLAGIDDVVTFASTATDILGPVNITSEAGGATGSINAGAVNVGGTTLEPHVSGGVEHLDIDVPSSTGAVYINRSDNGNPVDGGTGEIHVTKVHAPNELRLNPGTNINVSKKPIKNLDEIRTSTPSADLNIMNSIGAPGNNAGIRVKDISLYSGITRAGYIAGSSANGINTIELDTRTSNGTIKVNNNGSPAKIVNVADGVDPNDAVNVRQLEEITIPKFENLNIIYSVRIVDFNSTKTHHDIFNGANLRTNDKIIIIGEIGVYEYGRYFASKIFGEFVIDNQIRGSVVPVYLVIPSTGHIEWENAITVRTTGTNRVVEMVYNNLNIKYGIFNIYLVR